VPRCHIAVQVRPADVAGAARQVQLPDRHSTCRAGRGGQHVGRRDGGSVSTQFLVSEAAQLLGVSDDTVRRWADAGRLSLLRSVGGRLVVDGADLAALAQELAETPGEDRLAQSARNQLRGIVTRVVKDTVMAQVDMQAGPFRVVSLMSREAADELGLEVGTLAVASIKATNVVVGLPDKR
jgi:molybdopterin-binding protein